MAESLGQPLANTNNTSNGTSNKVEHPAERKRRCGFVLTPVKRAPARIPAAAEIVAVPSGAHRALPLPQAVLDRLGDPRIIVGFDCETHDWLDNAERKGRIGQFGWYTKNDDVHFSRIVQLGWVVAGPGNSRELVSKSSLIQPCGFQMSARATKCHGITHEAAMENGRALADVLEEFVRDASEACARGGRVCAHQLEFDAGLIDEELRRCGLPDLRKTWQQIARAGYCTMNPAVGRWLKECSGEDVGPETTKPIVGLTKTMRLLGLCPDSLQQRHHDAEHDARMAQLIYATLLNHARKDSSALAEAG